MEPSDAVLIKLTSRLGGGAASVAGPAVAGGGWTPAAGVSMDGVTGTTSTSPFSLDNDATVGSDGVDDGKLGSDIVTNEPTERSLRTASKGQ